MLDRWYNNYYNQTLYAGFQARFLHADFPVLRCWDCDEIVYSNGHFVRHAKRMEAMGYAEEDPDTQVGLLLQCSNHHMGPHGLHCHDVTWPTPFGNHNFKQDDTRLGKINLCLKQKIEEQYDSLPPSKTFEEGGSKQLFAADFAGLRDDDQVKDMIRKKREEKRIHREDRNPLYPAGPPMYRDGHKRLFYAGPLVGDLPPGIRPKHWQLPQADYYPNGEKKYSGIFYRDCPNIDKDEVRSIDRFDDGDWYGDSVEP